MTHTTHPTPLRRKRARRIGNAAQICCTCLALLLLLLGSGCISVDCGYSPNVALEQNTLPAPQKFPITFSVNLDTFRTDIFFAPTLKSLREKVHLALTHSGLFESVTYAPEAKRDTYHIAFRFFLGAQDENDDITIGLISGYTFCIIPTWQEITLDGDATLYLRGKPVYAIGKAEKQRVVIWLPFAAIGIFWNNAVGWHYVEKGVINGLINDLGRFHKASYLTPAS